MLFVCKINKTPIPKLHGLGYHTKVTNAELVADIKSLFNLLINQSIQNVLEVYFSSGNWSTSEITNMSNTYS